MKHSGIYNSCDSFLFDSQIVFRPYNKRWLVISVESANWLVLHSEFQKQALERLIEGGTIADLYKVAISEQQVIEIRKLLSAIKAREFAAVGKKTEINVLNNNLTLNCYLTNACNLCCDHCFMFSGHKLQNELTSKDWMRVLTDFRQENGQQVTFTGGEPMMAEDFPKILKHAHEIGLDTTVLTNGTLWNENNIRALEPYISEVQISIDGVDEITNAAVRGVGHFQDVLHTIIQFANLGVRTSVATTFTQRNLQGDTASLYAEMIHYINTQCSTPVLYKLSKKILRGRNTNYSDDDNKRFYKQILEIESKIDPETRVRNFVSDHMPNYIIRNCGYGGLSIAANGEVYMCNRIRELESYGNIREYSLSYFLEMGQKLLLRTSVEQMTPCKHCYLRFICGGGCRIDDCNFHGKLLDFHENLSQITCSDEFRKCLERDMIDSYEYYYTF